MAIQSVALKTEQSVESRSVVRRAINWLKTHKLAVGLFLTISATGAVFYACKKGCFAVFNFNPLPSQAEIQARTFLIKQPAVPAIPPPSPPLVKEVSAALLAPARTSRIEPPIVPPPSATPLPPSSSVAKAKPSLALSSKEVVPIAPARASRIERPVVPPSATPLPSSPSVAEVKPPLVSLSKEVVPIAPARASRIERPVVPVKKVASPQQPPGWTKVSAVAASCFKIALNHKGKIILLAAAVLLICKGRSFIPTFRGQPPPPPGEGEFAVAVQELQTGVAQLGASVAAVGAGVAAVDASVTELGRKLDVIGEAVGGVDGTFRRIEGSQEHANQGLDLLISFLGSSSRDPAVAGECAQFLADSRRLALEGGAQGGSLPQITRPQIGEGRGAGS